MILDIYNSIGKTDKDIASWINVMSYNSNKCWKCINCEDKPIFIETCKTTYDKRLIVSEKEDYDRSEYAELNVIDKDEAIDEIRPSKNVTSISGSTINKSTIGDHNS